MDAEIPAPVFVNIHDMPTPMFVDINDMPTPLYQEVEPEVRGEEGPEEIPGLFPLADIDAFLAGLNGQ